MCFPTFRSADTTPLFSGATLRLYINQVAETIGRRAETEAVHDDSDGRL